MPCKLLIKT